MNKFPWLIYNWIVIARKSVFFILQESLTTMIHNHTGKKKEKIAIMGSIYISDF